MQKDEPAKTALIYGSEELKRKLRRKDYDDFHVLCHAA